MRRTAVPAGGVLIGINVRIDIWVSSWASIWVGIGVLVLVALAPGMPVANGRWRIGCGPNCAWRCTGRRQGGGRTGDGDGAIGRIAGDR